MNQAVLIDNNGNKNKRMSLQSPVFNTPLAETLIHYVIVAKLSALRKGTAKTKKRGEVSGGGIKPWRQKGTGRARAGSIRSPLWNGGGTVFGPQPRTYKKKVNIKSNRKALCSLLSNRANLNGVYVVQGIPLFATPSTKIASEWLTRMGLNSGGLILLIDNSIDLNKQLSFRNLNQVSYIGFDELNILNAIKAEKIVFTEESLKSWSEKMERNL